MADKEQLEQENLESLKRIEELEQKLALADVSTNETSSSTDSAGPLVNAFNTIVQQQKNQKHNSGEIISIVTSQNSIRKFNGNEGPDRANAWIKELDKTRIIYGWSDEIAFNVAKLRLKGGART